MSALCNAQSENHCGTSIRFGDDGNPMLAEEMMKTALVGMLSLLVLPTAASTQSVERRMMSRAYLTVTMQTGPIDYGDQRVLGQGIAFFGEPVVFLIAIVNRYDGPIAGAERDWVQRITKTIYPGGRFEVDPARGTPLLCDPELASSNNVAAVGDDLHLAATSSQYMRCRTDGTLAPGRYTIEVAWSVDATRFIKRPEGDRGPSYLTGVLEFEIREVKSDADRLDLLNHRAAQAQREGRLDDALRSTEQVLQLNPNAFNAWLIRARVHRDQKRCTETAQGSIRAEQIFETDADSNNRSYGNLTASERREIIDEIRRIRVQCR